MSAQQPMREAMTELAARPTLLVGVAAVQSLVGYLVTVSSATALGPLMDRRPAAAQMLVGDDGLLIELLQRHQELGAIWATTALVALLLAVIIGWATAGTLLSALSGPRVRGAAQLARATVENLWPMTTVSLLGLILRALPLGTGALAWSWLRPELQGTFPSVMLAGAACIVALAIPWATVTVIIDYARVAVLTDGRAIPAFKRALSLAWQRRSATFTLALSNAGLFLLAVVIGQGFMSLTAPWILAHLVATLVAATLRVAVTAFGLTAAAAIYRCSSSKCVRSRYAR